MGDPQAIRLYNNRDSLQMQALTVKRGCSRLAVRCLHCRDKGAIDALPLSLWFRQNGDSSRGFRTCHSTVGNSHYTTRGCFASRWMVFATINACWRLVITRSLGIRLGKMQDYTKAIRQGQRNEGCLCASVSCLRIMLVDGLVYWHDERGLGARLRESFGDGYVSFRAQPGSVVSQKTERCLLGGR